MRRRVVALLVLVPAVCLGLLALPTVAQGATVPSSFSFSGAGWGHGVGMSQYGAYGQALEGRSASKILQHYYSGSTVGSYRDDQDLRVNLAYQSTRVRMRAEGLTSRDALLQVTLGGRTLKVGENRVVELKSVRAGVALVIDGSVRATGSRAIVRWSGTRSPGDTGSAPAVLNLVKGSSSMTTSGHRYRYGRVEVLARGSSSAPVLSAVNIVRLHDEYLYGIGEMPSSWPAAALQAQVIASRGYALVKQRQGVRQGCSCHVFADTADQVFVGWSKQAGPSGDRWTAAVKATHTSSTSSRVVLVKGVPAQTFFFSSSGGRTQNSEDVWSAQLSYLRSVDDRWSLNTKLNGNASWGPRVRTQAQVAAAFGLPNVVRVDLTDRYASGAVRLAKAWSSKGTYSAVAGATLVSRLSLTSRWYWTTGNAPATAPKSTTYTVTPTNRSPRALPGEPLRISGTVKPAKYAAGENVQLRRWDVSSGRWRSAGYTKVDSLGRWKFYVTSSVPTAPRYQVYKAADSCGRGCTVKAASSADVNATIGATFVVKASSTAKAIEAGRVVRVSGSVTPAKYAVGNAVVIKRYDAVRKIWLKATTTRVDASGRYSVLVPARSVGQTALRVSKGGEHCTKTRCLFVGDTSASLPLLVQRTFSVTGAASSPSRGTVVVKGTVSPAASAVGDQVRIRRLVDGAWKNLGYAKVSSTGRYSATFRGLPSGRLTLIAIKSAEGCTDLCRRPADATPRMTVTVR